MSTTGGPHWQVLVDAALKFGQLAKLVELDLTWARRAEFPSYMKRPLKYCYVLLSEIGKIRILLRHCSRQ
jgi:hypothetical protein